MTVYNPIKNLATVAAELACQFAKGKPIIANGIVPNGQKDVPSVLLPTIVVHRGNMRETVIKDGFHSEADVYGSKKDE